MSILKLISSDNYWVVNKSIARLVGLEAAVLYADLASAQNYWNEVKGHEDWFFKTQANIQEDTTLSPKLQRKHLPKLVELGLLKTELKGLPAKQHFILDDECVQNLLRLLGTSCKAQREQQEVTKGNTNKNKVNNNINNNIIGKEEVKISYPFTKEEEEKYIVKLDNDELERKINKEKEKKLRKKKKKELVFVYPESFSPNLIHHCNEFFEYRKEAKKSFKSQRGVNGKIKEFLLHLQEYGEEAVIQSINNAIANGYQGTFIPKEYQNKTKNNNNVKTNGNTWKERQTDLVNRVKENLNNSEFDW